jgi:serine/threonine-protein kinase
MQNALLDSSTKAALGIAPTASNKKPITDRHSVKLNPGYRLVADTLRLENLEFLGSGGNGSVFRMLITEGELRGLIVAVKFLETLGDDQRAKRFEQEINVLQQVNHPHVIRVLDTGKLPRSYEKVTIPFFVMEYQPRNLDRETSAHPRGLHPDAVLPLCLQMASALAHIHTKDIVHRDLKPANILFDGSNIKIADFGLASLLDRSSFVQTTKGQKAAPLYYISPEQWKWWKEETDATPGKESDVFQLGLIFVKMLTGYNPNTVHAWRCGESLHSEPKLNIRVQSGSLVSDTTGLVKEMIEVDPVKRPTAGDVQERLLGIFRAYSSHFSALYGVQPGREF